MQAAQRFYELGWVTAWAATGGNLRFSVAFAVEKRSTPTVGISQMPVFTDLQPSGTTYVDRFGFVPNYRSTEMNFSWAAAAEL